MNTPTHDIPCPMADETGYPLETTLWDEFSSSRTIPSVSHTFSQAEQLFQNDHLGLSELALVLIWKTREYATRGNRLFEKHYRKLTALVLNKAKESLPKQELYHFNQTLALYGGI